MFTNSLRISNIQNTVYFEHIHNPLLTATITTLSSLPTQPWAFFLSFIFPLSLLYEVQLLLGVGTALECDWSTRDHIIKENWLNLPVATKCPWQLRLWWALMPTLSHLCWDFVWLELARSSAYCHIVSSSFICPVVSNEHSYLNATHQICLL